MTRVWITRALPGADQTACRVRNLGLIAVVAPLLEVRDLEVGPIDLRNVGAVAFTSANGVRAFAAQSDHRRGPVFAVGDSTATAARMAGFTEVISAGGDVAALAGLVAERAPLKGEVLHLGAREPAGDLSGALVAAGIPARRLDIYKTVERSLTEADILEVQNTSIVLLHSPRAALAICKIHRKILRPETSFFCLSSAVATPLRALAPQAVFVASAPTETALMALLAARMMRP